MGYKQPGRYTGKRNKNSYNLLSIRKHPTNQLHRKPTNRNRNTNTNQSIPKHTIKHKKHKQNIQNHFF